MPISRSKSFQLGERGFGSPGLNDGEWPNVVFMQKRRLPDDYAHLRWGPWHRASFSVAPRDRRRDRRHDVEADEAEKALTLSQDFVLKQFPQMSL